MRTDSGGGVRLITSRKQYRQHQIDPNLTPNCVEYNLLETRNHRKQAYTVADPGFPVGGCGPRRGGVDSRGGYVSKFCMLKRKNVDH